MEFKSYEESGVNNLLLDETQISAALNNIHPLHKSVYEKLLELKNKGTKFGATKKTYLLVKNHYSRGGTFEKLNNAVDCYSVDEQIRITNIPELQFGIKNTVVNLVTEEMTAERFAEDKLRKFNSLIKFVTV